MSKSGSKIHKEIKTTLKQVESEAEAVEKEVFTYEKQLSSLTTERETCYATLATTYLPELEAESVRQTISQVQNEVSGIFEKKQRRREQLDNLMRDANTQRGSLELQLEEVNSMLNQKTAERDGIKRAITDELLENRSYTDLNSQAKQSSARLEQNKARVEEAKREASEKLPQYEGNKLFSYLAKRGFGTPEYSHGNLVTTLDSWVAKIVGYRDAKKCYDFLRSMPDLMTVEVGKRQKELEEIVVKMRKAEDDSGERHGLPKVLTEGEEIGKKRAEVMAGISRTDKEHEEYSEERKEIDSEKDPYHIDAIQKLKSYLKGETVAKLKDMARKTPGTDDDLLVGRIEEIDLTVRGLKDRVKDAKAKREAYDEKVKGLRTVEKKFTSNDYESDRSYFPDSFDVSDFLTGYLLGKYNSGHVWSQLESNQNFEPVVHHHTSSSYDYGGSSHSSSYDSGSSSWGSGGGFGGGGWSSGSGF